MFLFRWLWKNMEGVRFKYICGLLLEVIYTSMFIITPYFTSQITDIDAGGNGGIYGAERNYRVRQRHAV